MIFRHRVKYNGVLYLAGQDVPIEEDVKPVEEEKVEAQEPQKQEEEEKPVRKRGRRAKRD